jgi:hypothetical protein
MSLSPSKQIALKLERLENEKQALQNILCSELNLLYDTIKDPSKYIKNTVSTLASDKSFISDLLAVAFQFILKRYKSDAGKSSETYTAYDKNESEPATNFLKIILTFLQKKFNGDDRKQTH